MLKKILCGIVILLVGCRSNEKRLESEIDMFIGTELIFSSNLINNSLKQNFNFSEIITENYKIIVYIDSSGCLDCRLLDLYLWDNKKMETTDDKHFELLAIINSKTISENKLSEYKFHFPVLIDHNGDFEKDNPDIPSVNTILHTFLLNPQNKVVVVGNPLFNSALWDLYLEEIRY